MYRLQVLDCNHSRQHMVLLRSKADKCQKCANSQQHEVLLQKSRIADKQ